MKFPLWMARLVKNILKINANRADSHDADLAQSYYETAGRPAAGLAKPASLNSFILAVVQSYQA